MNDSFAYIRSYYKVPAKRGGRVIYTGEGTPRHATILSADGQYLWLRFDDDGRRNGPFHPTWELSYEGES